MSLSLPQSPTFNHKHHIPQQQLFRPPLGEAELAVGFQVSVSENIVLVLTIVHNQAVVCLRVKYVKYEIYQTLGPSIIGVSLSGPLPHSVHLRQALQKRS